MGRFEELELRVLFLLLGKRNEELLAVHGHEAGCVLYHI
jgi:hypothetical protein